MRKMPKVLLLLFLAFMAFPPSFSSTPPSGYYVLTGSGTCLMYDANDNVLFNGDAVKLEGKEISLGDTLDTGDGTVIILLHYPDLSRMTVDQDSSFKVKDDHSLWLSLGKVWVKISHLFTQPANFQVESPNAVAVAHGTEFEVDQAAHGGASSVHVFEGTVQVNSGNAPVVALSQGYFLSTIQPGAVVKPAAFDLKNIQNPWWKWNLAKEERIHLFLQTHHALIFKMLKAKGLPLLRMRLIRVYLWRHGLTRRSFGELYFRVNRGLPGARRVFMQRRYMRMQQRRRLREQQRRRTAPVRKQPQRGNNPP